MKRIILLAAALLAFAPAAVSAETVVKAHRDHVTVKHRPGRPGHVVVKPGRPGRPGPVAVRPPGRRPGQFWHRGSWAARIHGPAFRYPRGWHYRAWRVGAILPALFLTSEYFYDDYAGAGLQAPPPGYRWVRYGPDLLLVNLRTGEVEDVVSDVFD